MGASGDYSRMHLAKGVPMTKAEKSILEYLVPHGLVRGRAIHEALRIGTVRFYFAAARLEDYRLVRCRVTCRDSVGWLLSERWYEITAAGRMALELERESERPLTQDEAKE